MLYKHFLKKECVCDIKSVSGVTKKNGQYKLNQKLNRSVNLMFVIIFFYQNFVLKIYIPSSILLFIVFLHRLLSGLLTGAQPCTYDRATYGIDTFIGCLYLCALRYAH